MKTLLISAVIATLAGVSASYAAPVPDKQNDARPAFGQTATSTHQKADTSNWHADAYPHEHHRNKYTG
ncbi:hypothetical protein H4S14_001443 [Agrobacterium vitis]|nr:hypothetical protein [Agrobacterium vitis]MBE1437705.1 hypothetical protein [Agrobacterium vitis]